MTLTLQLKEDTVKRYRIISTTLLAVFLIGGLLACQTTSRMGGQPVTDSTLAAQVRDKIASNGMITTYSLDVQANGGNVILQGAVDNYSQKTRAGDLARSVDGVQSVDNQLDVVEQDRSTPLPQ